MRRLKEVLGLKVMNRANAEQVGKVGGLVLDCPGRRFSALRLSGPDKDHQFVDWDHVTGAGSDAVVIESADRLRPASGPVEEKVRAGTAEVVGKRVLTDQGDELGRVDDVEFDPDSGTVDAVLVAGQRVGPERLRSIGSYALVVAAEG